MSAFGEWEGRGDARADTRFHFRTCIESVVRAAPMFGSGCRFGLFGCRPRGCVSRNSLVTTLVGV
jgi:hypothetical protein